MNTIKRAFLFAVFAFLGCTAIQQQQGKTRADDLQFHNLQVLPQNITREELLGTMRAFTRSLGVRCDYCHAARTDDASKLDFASDANPQKNRARVMMRMTQRINADYVSKLPRVPNDADPPMTVGCWTCHRGKPQPEAPPAAPAEPEHH
ncbi:MAG TPA: c-type cytochrome [Thermoanaerobaculia bacterium]|jgi:hypothetical protein